MFFIFQGDHFYILARNDVMTHLFKNTPPHYWSPTSDSPSGVRMDNVVHLCLSYIDKVCFYLMYLYPHSYDALCTFDSLLKEVLGNEAGS